MAVLILGAFAPTVAAAQVDVTQQQLEAMALSGDTGAQLSLAHAYETGSGVLQDFEQAVRWYRNAFESGSADGVFNLARLTARGLGTDADPKAAFDLFRTAESMGHARASLIVGSMIETQTGTVLSPRQAAAHYRRAANGGVAEAATALGAFYQKGAGLEADFVKAAQWYQRGLEMGDAMAANGLGVMLVRGEGVDKDHALAAEYFEIAVAVGSHEAMNNLAVLLESGLGVPLDEPRSEALRRQAGALERARRTTAESDRVRQTVERVQDPNFNLATLQAQALAGQREAQFALGQLYANGWVVALDYVQGHAWLNIASQPDSLGSVDDVARDSANQRDRLAERMTVSQLNDAQALARTLLAKHASDE